MNAMERIVGTEKTDMEDRVVMVFTKGGLRRSLQEVTFQKGGDEINDEARLWLHGKESSRWKKKESAKALKRDSCQVTFKEK